MKTQKRGIFVITAMALTVLMLLTGCVATVELPDSALAEATEQSALPQPASLTPVADAEENVSYISIDINPSIRLVIKDGVVEEAKAYNDDGEEILADNEAAGLLPAEAVILIVTALAQQGYMDSDDASLVITACGDKEEEMLESLKDAANQSLSELGIECDVVASCITQPIVDEAKQVGLTPGRYLVIKYLAEKDGISFEEAQQKYGAYKMGQMLRLVENPGDVFGHRDEADWDEVTGSLTPEQQELLKQAKNAYEAAMREAQQQFVKTKKLVNSEIRTEKAKIQNAYKTGKDLEQYKQAKKALQQAFLAMRQEAREAFFAARAEAKRQFEEAVRALGLDEATIKALLGWDYDLDWDSNMDWNAEIKGDDDKDKDDTQSGKPVNPGKGKADSKPGNNDDDDQENDGANVGKPDKPGKGNADDNPGKGNAGGKPGKNDRDDDDEDDDEDEG